MHPLVVLPVAIAVAFALCLLVERATARLGDPYTTYRAGPKAVLVTGFGLAGSGMACVAVWATATGRGRGKPPWEPSPPSVLWQAGAVGVALGVVLIVAVAFLAERVPRPTPTTLTDRRGRWLVASSLVAVTLVSLAVALTASHIGNEYVVQRMPFIILLPLLAGALVWHRTRDD